MENEVSARHERWEIIIRLCGLGCAVCCCLAQRREADLVADYHIAFWLSCYCDYITYGM